MRNEISEQFVNKARFKRVMQELIIRHREYAESIIAKTISADVKLASPVVVVAQQIMKIMQLHESEVRNIIAEKANKILEDLFKKDRYQYLEMDQNHDLFDNLYNALSAANQHPERAMHVQMCMIYRVLPSIKTLITEEVQRLWRWYDSQLTASCLLNHRIRREKTRHPNRSEHGICQSDFFRRKIGSKMDFCSPKDRTHLDTQSEFFCEAESQSMPLACGPSGHASTTLKLTYLFALTPEQRQQYTLFLASFLVSAGAHSMHEAFVVASHVGVHYRPGDYASLFHYIDQQGNTAVLAMEPKTMSLLQQHNFV